MEDQTKQKRRPGYPITINKNVEAVKAKIQGVCTKHHISASALFEAIIDSFTDEDWDRYAQLAIDKKRGNNISINMNAVSPERREKLKAALVEAGVAVP